MNSDDFTPMEQELIKRLQNAPQRRLTPRVEQAIQEKILAEVLQSRLPAPPTNSAGVAITPMQFILGLAAVCVVVVGVVVAIEGQRQQNPPISPAASMETTAPTTEPPSIVTTTSELIETSSSTPSITSSPLLTDTPTSTHTPAPTPTPTVSSVIIEGVIEELSENILKIGDTEIVILAHHPVLELIDVGDVLRVEGTWIADGILLADVVSNLPGAADADATVGMVGPIEFIDEGIITINGIEVIIDPRDLVGQSLSIGDFLSVEGNFKLQGARYLLVVSAVEVITKAGMSVSPDCYYEETGMSAMGMSMGMEGMAMGRWRCNGMGAMGMGMGMGGMGMGN
jgi:uridine phosphorylase